MRWYSQDSIIFKHLDLQIPHTGWFELSYQGNCLSCLLAEHESSSIHHPGDENIKNISEHKKSYMFYKLFSELIFVLRCLPFYTGLRSYLHVQNSI